MQPPRHHNHSHPVTGAEGLKLLPPPSNPIRLEPARYDEDSMRLLSPQDLSEGGTPGERLDLAFRKVLTVPNEALLKEEEREKAAREKKRAAKEAALTAMSKGCRRAN